MKNETVPINKRIYLTLSPGAGGCAMLRASYLPPAVGEAMVALLSRGVLMEGDSLAIPLVSDPSQNNVLRGPAGRSAYELAKQDGYAGTQAQWLTSLIGAPGASAYEVAKAGGFAGTQAQWLASLVGAAGASAYDVAKAGGFSGTQAQWLASLKGKDASSYLGPITVSQTATAAIAAGARRVPVTIPASLGVAAGDPLIFCPAVSSAAYAIHDVVAVSATSLSIGVTGPLLAIGAAMPPIAGKLFRLTL
jgi:hypothetical protein